MNGDNETSRYNFLVSHVNGTARPSPGPPPTWCTEDEDPVRVCVKASERTAAVLPGA